MIRAINVKQFKFLLVSLLISIGTGLLSAAVTGDPSAAYQALQKPSFSPPQWVFPVVWTVLFILIGIAAYLVGRNGREKPGVREALFYYGVTLLLTFFWSPIFFRWGLYGLAVIWVILILIAAIITTIKFWNINRAAGILFVPFTAWVAFATVLTTTIWWLNRVNG